MKGRFSFYLSRDIYSIVASFGEGPGIKFGESAKICVSRDGDISNSFYFEKRYKGTEIYTEILLYKYSYLTYAICPYCSHMELWTLLILILAGLTFVRAVYLARISRAVEDCVMNVFLSVASPHAALTPLDPYTHPTSRTRGVLFLFISLPFRQSEKRRA